MSGRIGETGARARTRMLPPMVQECTVQGVDGDGMAWVTVNRLARAGQNVQRGPCYWMRSVDEAGVPLQPESGDMAFLRESDSGKLWIDWVPQ